MAKGRQHRGGGDEAGKPAGRCRSCGFRPPARSTARAGAPARGMRAPTSCRVTGASASMTKPGTMPASRQSAASSAHRREREAVGFVRALRLRRARPAEEGDAEALTKQAAGQRRRQAPAARPTAGTSQLQPPLRQFRAQQDRLEGEPFRDKAVERRQRRDRRAADQKQRTRSRGMRWISPPSRSMSRSPVAISTAPAPKNNRLLNSGVIEDVKQRRGHRERRGRRHRIGAGRRAQVRAR